MSDGGLWDGSVAALLGALSGGLVSWAIASRAQTRERRARYYERFEQILDELQAMASGYWRTAGLEPDVERRLISQLESLDVSLEALLRGVSSEHVSATATKLIDILTEDVTGGSFQTAARRRDAMRVVNIKARCKALKDLLHSA